ncbi:MAG: hypothetical protein NTX15_08595, partial [Candidatus Kapabacteria bacterium]|nr:hypothetical protein [Candidatus Kapabacteria bacterium]
MVDVIPFDHSGSEDAFDLQSVPVGNHTTFKRVIVCGYEGVEGSSANAHYIRIVDVTNPRSPNGHLLKIRILGHDQILTTNYSSFHGIVAYTDPSSYDDEEHYEGDAFLVAAVSETNIAPGSPDTNARYIVINLTKALDACGSSTSNIMEIYDAGMRDVKLNGTVLGNPDIYVGYVPVPADYYQFVNASGANQDYDGPHNLFCDEHSGIFVESPDKQVKQNSTSTTVYAMVDLFNLNTLRGFSGSTALGVLNRLTMDGTKPLLFGNENGEPIWPSASNIYDIGTNKIRLYVASSSWDNRIAVTTPGAVVADIDYSSPNAITRTNQSLWTYDLDRRYPDRQTSPPQGSDVWLYHLVHTVAPYVPVGSSDQLVLTTDEITQTAYNLGLQSSNPITVSSGNLLGGLNELYLFGT